MVTEYNIEPNAVLTSPLSLESGSDLEYKAPNLVQRLLSLFKNVRPGSNLTQFQLPPLFNLPKSQLQCFGESLYCVGDDMLSKCIDGKSPLERFAAVVGWSISTTRPAIFGVAPFNPILGETHHVSRGNLNVMLEQVSHHPPVTALHATDETKNVETIWCHNIIPKFYGTSIEAVVYGKRKLKLSSYDENYVMNAPKLLIRFFPVPSADWVGNVTIRCKEIDLEAELCYKGPSLLGFRGNNRSIKGKIIESSTSKTIFEISGHWDRTVLIKDVMDGKTTIIHDAKKSITKLNAPLLKDPKGLCSNESAVVWGEVSQAILRKEWEKARGAKNVVEEKERVLRRERECKGETWIPNHFTLSYSKEEGWDCTPKLTLVPPAPIVAP
ncbi:Oxysterol-binding protein-related protein 4b [Thalictrum thalictroides]|uniref:Oxysterol-binding protein-related protein 4b n=1 Tax=Thalictrum thalictroides TaxID=46969 RepID=A0A7J6VGA5_THATH|nr:Oxysterol-binding protein-related protein 4b [Thalictrum thalictroides]